MKLKFKNQDFQTEAVNSVADLFKGQEKANTTFSVDENVQQINFLQNEFGFGNKLMIDDDTLISNMHEVQKRHKLPITRDFDSKQYSIEMETGTGKTYVYTKTILELNKRYGFTKFIVVVPSIAIREALEIISKNRHSLAIDGIKYVKLAGEQYYAQEIFDSSELVGYLDKNAVAVNHSVYDYLLYDSGVESRFAESLDNDPDVKMFFKIPSRFKIDTPIGSYNPDWAVFLEKNGEQKLYFVIESKGTTALFDLRTPEQLKIH